MLKRARLVGLMLAMVITAAQILRGAAQATGADADHHVKRVLFISIDGMHALDVANYVKAHPDSALAKLSAHGVTYTQAWTSKPSDSFPGTLAEFTGGTPISTGVWYCISYDRKLSRRIRNVPRSVPRSDTTKAWTTIRTFSTPAAESILPICRWIRPADAAPCIRISI